MTDMQGGTAADVGTVADQVTDQGTDLRGAAGDGVTDAGTAEQVDQAGQTGDAAGQGDAPRPTEADLARQALEASAETRQRAVEAFTISSFLSQNAAIALRYGSHDPAFLANALSGMRSWEERAADALSALGEDIDRPAPVPTPDVIGAELEQIRAMAYAHLLDLAACARSHAEVLAKMPDDTPTLIAIGRSMTENFNAANGALLGIGMLMRARAAA